MPVSFDAIRAVLWYVANRVGQNSSTTASIESQTRMTIALHDLTNLLEDKGALKRIDALLDRLATAERTIAESSEAIGAIDRELQTLGIAVEPDEADAGAENDSRNGESPTLDGDANAMPSLATRPAKPRSKPALPAEDPTDARSVLEYVNALDEVAHELGAAGATGTRGVDITEAMERRGYPNGKRVLKVARAHPSWNEVEGQRSRFRYAAVATAQPSPGANVASSGDGGADRIATHLEVPDELVPAGADE